MKEESINTFLEHISTSQAYSENTVIAYRNDLAQFLKFIGSTTLSQIESENVQQYIQELQDRGYASSTIARKVAATKTFLSYLHQSGKLNRDISKQVETPSVQRQTQSLLSRQQVNQLLAVPSKSRSPKDLRNQVLLDLLYTADLKVNELIELKADSFDGSHITIRQSDGTRRKIHLNETTIQHLEDYLKWGRPALEKGTGDEALFLNHRGQTLTRQGLWLIIKTCAQQAKLPASVTPHILRHSFDLHQQQGIDEEQV